MPRYRKKPVVIEAMQWDGSWESAEQIRQTLGDDVSYEAQGFGTALYCATRNGEVKANVGEWIVKGVEGEVYPVKPSIFAATHESVDDEDKNPAGQGGVWLVP